MLASPVALITPLVSNDALADVAGPFVMLSVEPDGTHHLTVEQSTYRDVAAYLQDKTGIYIDVSDAIGGERISLKRAYSNLESMLQQLAGSSVLVYDRHAAAGGPVSATLIESKPEDILPGAQEKRSDAAKENAILMRGATLMTGTKEPLPRATFPAALVADPGTFWHIVQFAPGRAAAGKARLGRAGLSTGHYIPNDAYVVKAGRDILEALRLEAGISHIEPYHPFFKLHEKLLDQVAHAAAQKESGVFADRAPYTMLLHAGETSLSTDVIKHVEEQRRQHIAGQWMIDFVALPGQIEYLARDEAVQWIEPRLEYRAMNDLASRTIGTSALKYRRPDLRGSNIVIAVTDSGLDLTHPAFSNRIAGYTNAPSVTTDGHPGDTDGHGTHVSGSLLGSGALSETVKKSPGSSGPPFSANQFAGMAPGASLVMIEDFNSFTDAVQADYAWRSGAHLLNNSWGSAELSYSARSMAWDALVRDASSLSNGNQQLTVFFAAGNDGAGDKEGMGGLPYTINSPGNAKNVITIGAVEQKRLANNLSGATEETDSDWQVASFSSRGPVGFTDRRVKPDLVAPGAYVISTQSRDTNPDILQTPFSASDDYRAGNVDTGTNYAFYSGTSMATPLAAGAGALFIDYWLRDVTTKSPSPALVKAGMIGAARNLNTFKYVNNTNGVVAQGWGLVDSVRTVFGPGISTSDRIVYRDQEIALDQDAFYSETITNNQSSGGIKIVLAWTDKPGNPGNARALVNNLDLEVLGPGSSKYQGNVFQANGIHSLAMSRLAAGSPDLENNVEVILVPDANPGIYTIRVFARNVPDGPQDFALVYMTGIGREQRFAGKNPAAAMGMDERFYVAFSAPDENNQEQVFVKYWKGDIGDLTRFDEWITMRDNWFGLNDQAMNSAMNVGISASIEPSRKPSIAVNNSNEVFVAWQQFDVSGSNSYVALRAFVDSVWSEIGDSVRGRGISAGLPGFSVDPVVKTGRDGRPLVAWAQHYGASNKIHLARFDGTNWVGYGSSLVSGVASAVRAESPALAINSNGYPVVAWVDQAGAVGVYVYEWNGSSWIDRGRRGQTSTWQSFMPHLANAPDGEVFLTWLQNASGTSHVMAERYKNGSWSAMAGSNSGTGVSQSTNLNARFANPRIAYAAQPAPTVFVSWETRSGTSAVINLRKHELGSASWVGVSQSADSSGLSAQALSSTGSALAVTTRGVPLVAHEYNDGTTQQNELLSLARVSDVTPPIFDGLKQVNSGVSNVVLRWNPATDNFVSPGNLRYKVFMGTNVSLCQDIISCSGDDVFSSTNYVILTNTTEYVWSNLVAFASRCFGVRALDLDDRDDGNRVVLDGYPVSATNQTCGNAPVPSTCLIDELAHISSAWRLAWFGTNSVCSNVVMATCPGGITISNAYLYGTDPFSCDTDGDGLTDSNEIFVTKSSPTNPDTDGDGLADGSDPDIYRAWTGSNDISDVDALYLGYTNLSSISVYSNLYTWPMTATNIFMAGWIKSNPDPLANINWWHVSMAQPVARRAAGTNQIIGLDDPVSTNYLRMAIDSSGINTGATYAAGNIRWAAGLDSPVLNATGVDNLFVSFKEYLGLEANKDFARVLVRSSGTSNNWTEAGVARTGFSTNWSTRVIDISSLAGHSNIQIRLLMTADDINNAHAGWYVADLRVYAGMSTRVMVRDIQGCPLPNSEIAVIGVGQVTNLVRGHRVVNPGKVMASAITGSDGWALLRGVPRGKVVIRASQPSHRPEFWSGPLFNGAYGFGQHANPGVFRIDQSLILNTSTGLPANLHFELERGRSDGYVLVASGSTNHPLSVNYRPRLDHWNGVSNFTDYATYASIDSAFNNANWYTNRISPNYLSGLSSGKDHIASLSNRWELTTARFSSRPGEFTRLAISTNLGEGFLDVTAQGTGSYAIWLNGMPTGSNTPARLRVKSGTHWVSLVHSNRFIPALALDVQIPSSNQIVSRAIFTESMIIGTNKSASLDIFASDASGSSISNAQIIINGQRTLHYTPTNLVVTPGAYQIGFVAEGYKLHELLDVLATDGAATSVRVTMEEADLDFDDLGDATEISARIYLANYVSIFSYDGVADPDSDGLSSAEELGFRDEYQIDLNPGNADTDGDGLSDGAEIGYDGTLTNNGVVYYASSYLTSNTIISGTSLRMAFLGQFLDGVSGFRTGPVVRLSINGTIVSNAYTSNSFTAPTNRVCAEIVFDNFASGVVSNALKQSDPAGVKVYADTNPGLADTDGDGMWDGFEGLYGMITNETLGVARILDPIERAGANDDPDGDGLVNLLEFLGANLLADTNDWTYPNNPDSDGDGMPDGWEFFLGLDPRDDADASADPDGDGLSNLEEYQAGANPFETDSDFDGLDDYLEVMVIGSLAYEVDSDRDGLGDGDEFFTFGTDPADRDSDGDGMPDGFEVLDAYGNLRPEDQRLDPLSAEDADDDPDGDGLSNLQEFLVRDGLFGAMPDGYTWDYSTDPFNPDSDGDGMSDRFEAVYGLHPMDPVLDHDGQLLTRFFELGPDGDLDRDGLWNLRESQYRSPTLGTNSFAPLQVMGTNPRNRDTDGDGLTDGDEDRIFGSDPLRQDTDGDGLMDGTGVEGFWGEVQSPSGSSNHYDYALNDLWQLIWPRGEYYPYWRQVSPAPDPIHGNPMPRWAHASTYIPVFEEDLPSSGRIYFDNRQLVVMGGRHGVSELGDVWEYVLNSNNWRLVAGISNDYGGLSLISRFYDEPGLDTLRPNVFGLDPFNVNNLDATLIFGGVDANNTYNNQYLTVYKSTDDPRPVGLPILRTETNIVVIGGVTSEVEVVVEDFIAIPKLPASSSILNEGDFSGWRKLRMKQAMAYDSRRDRAMIFGGLDGNQILGDLQEGQFRLPRRKQIESSREPMTIWWRTPKLDDNAPKPAPRYGHSLVYDVERDKFVLFGGFSESHQPLNDLWQFTPAEYIDSFTNDFTDKAYRSIEIISEGFWSRIDQQPGVDWPQPRGGSMMIYFGDFDYDRGFADIGGDYCVDPNPQQIVLFGGTDGNQYFNDTWLFDGASWSLIQPNGPLSRGPSPRAYSSFSYAQNVSAAFVEELTFNGILLGDCATPSAFLFGGRAGALLTSQDTDGDLVDDGLEHSIGGPGSGRDPRWNALIHTNSDEVAPFDFTPIGPMAGGTTNRGEVADMESLLNDQGLYGLSHAIPWEEFPVVINASANQWGVEARTEDRFNLWWHRAEAGSDGWEIGVPLDSLGDFSAPAYARSGRRVFATNPQGNYPVNGTMDLFSPRFDLSRGTTASSNEHYLIFHEWLDLANDNIDYVQIDLIRPQTDADILNRLSGLATPDSRLLGPRYHSANTTGRWHRVTVPLNLSGTESNLYVRFRLFSDGQSVAGGWQIDDVAIVQGGRLEINLDEDVYLVGANDGRIIKKLTKGTDGVTREALLPAGNYRLVGSSGPLGSFVGDPSMWNAVVSPELLNIRANPLVFRWEAMTGYPYQIQYNPDLATGTWSALGGIITATSNPAIFIETNPSSPQRFYRVIPINP